MKKEKKTTEKVGTVAAEDSWVCIAAGYLTFKETCEEDKVGHWSTLLDQPHFM